jgi:hypothetical protein
MLVTLLRKLVSWILIDLLFSCVRRWFAGELSLQKLADKVLSSLPKLSGKPGEGSKRKSLP